MVIRFTQKLVKKAGQFVYRYRYSLSPKVFCVGRNKTGTTSMASIFRELDLAVAPQRPAERLALEWTKGNYTRLLRFVKYRGQAFQDLPFSLPGCYATMDKAFPGSKFILTVRDSADVWYRSLTSFHSKKFSDGRLPTKADLQQADYLYPGFAWEINRILYKSPEENPYDETVLKANYEAHNESVVQYFADRPESLLVVNLKDTDAAIRISNFLNTGKTIDRIPWKNKT